MEEIEFRYKSRDGSSIYAVKWQPESEQPPKGIVQIVHGMAEHIGRYKRFAEALTEVGFLVFGSDHRGHGQTVSGNDPIFFHEENGWDKIVEDVKILNDLIREEQPSLPLFLFGHSMGSFISKCYIQKFGRDLSGVILSGTGYVTKWSNAIPLWLAERDVRKQGDKSPSKILAPIISRNYNRAFKPLRTESDWLSRDPAEVDRFIQDPYCGREASTGFYRDMLRGMGQMDDPVQVAHIPKDLAILLIAGDKDPVGGFGKAIRKTQANYRKAGLESVEVKLYKGARHELLNETNRDEVTRDLLNWLNEHK